MSAAEASPQDPALGRWPVSVVVPVAWGDMDAFGHVNNAVYLRWFESARIAYFERSGVVLRMKDEGVGPILARTTCDYRLPIAYPDTVTASATIVRLGTTSFVMEYRVTSAKHGGALAAKGEAVVVMVDYRRAGAKVPLDERLRRGIVELEATASP